MNILFLNSIAADVFGGLESWIGFVSKGLIARGHTITAIGRPNSEFLRRTKLTAGQVTTIPLSISGDFNPTTIRRLRREIEQRSIDILICNFNKDIRLGGLAVGRSGTTKVIWRAGNNLTRNRWIHRYLTPRLLDGVITPSHELKRQATALGYIRPEMVRVIHTGIPELPEPIPREIARSKLRKKFNLAEDAIVAVTSGRFVDQKGHEFLIRAMAELVKQTPDLHCIFLGDGPLESQLTQQIAHAGLQKHFSLPGLLDDFELELAGSDLMLHPALIEPFGIVLLEGMRASLPIVASRVGGIPEVIDDNVTGYLVEPGSSDQLTSAAARLLAKPSLRESMGSAGCRRWREHFCFDVMLDNLESYLGGLMARETAGA